MASRLTEPDKAHQVEWQVLGKCLKVKTTEPEKLADAMQWIEKKLTEVQKDKPYSSSTDQLLLLLLEAALEREELKARGKDLLKRADLLVNYTSKMTRSS